MPLVVFEQPGPLTLVDLLERRRQVVMDEHVVGTDDAVTQLLDAATVVVVLEKHAELFVQQTDRSNTIARHHHAKERGGAQRITLSGMPTGIAAARPAACLPCRHESISMRASLPMLLVTSPTMPSDGSRRSQ
ncbi:MAG: hypothetical protein R3E68_20405 [Burkholderiaceae bacterium]